MKREEVLPNLIGDVAEREPEKVLIEEIGGRVLTYADFHGEAQQWARACAALGIRRDSLVATVLHTSTHAYVCWIGLAWLRAPEVPINPEFRGSSLVYALNNCAAEVLFMSERHLEKLSPIAGDLQYLKTVVVPDATTAHRELPWQVVTGEEFLSESRDDCLQIPEYHDTHAVIYTSGTTGPSKGVLQPWACIQGFPAGIFPGDARGGYDDGAVYTAWPMFHASGRYSLCIAGQHDLRMVLRESFSLSSFWSEIREHRCTHATLLVVGGLLMRQPEQPDDRDNPLQRVGLYPLIPQYRDFEQRFGVRTSAAYGMTEVGFAATTGDPKDHKVAGKPLPGYHIRIVNDLDEDVPRNTFGEIVIRHDLPWRLNKGYLGQPEATANAWRNGWFHTGDAGIIDDDGDLYFVDRLKDYLRHRGHNVSSFEVESEVLSHDAVLECACVGVPSGLANPDDAVSDNDVKVFVVKKPEADLRERELFEFLLPRMARFMVPRYIEFVDALPRTPSQKVRKVDLRERPVVGPSTWDRVTEGLEVPR